MGTHSSCRAGFAARVVALVAAALALLAVTPERAGASGLCVPVRARGVGQDLENFTTEATIFVGQVAIGRTDATFTPTGSNGNILTFTGPIVFTADAGLGTLTVTAEGRVNVSTGRFVSAGPITAAIGALAGTTGRIHITGVQDLTTGEFTEQIVGRLCATGHDSAPRSLFAPA